MKFPPNFVWGAATSACQIEGDACAGGKDRFGLVHVDFATQKRTPKDSFFWYRDLIAQQR